MEGHRIFRNPTYNLRRYAVKQHTSLFLYIITRLLCFIYLIILNIFVNAITVH